MKWFVPLFAACATGSAVFAHSGATGIVKERMDGMKAMSNATKALGAVRAGVVPYSPQLIIRAATDLRDHADAAGALFPEGSDTGKSEALPVIWTDRAGFDALMQELITAANQLEAVAEDEAAASLAADAVAKTCKDCHAKYREKKL